MKKNLLIALMTIFIMGCAKNGSFSTAEEMVNHISKNVNMIQPSDLNQLMEDYEVYTLIDVRQELEYYHGFIPGTVNIPRGSLEFNIGDSSFWDATGLYMPEPNERIILYCQKGQRSILAADALQKLGYSNVYVLKGGWKNWELTFPDIFEKDLEKLSGNKESNEKVGSC